MSVTLGKTETVRVTVSASYLALCFLCVCCNYYCVSSAFYQINDLIWINRLFLVVNLLQCAVTDIVLFSVVAFETDMPLGSVATHLRCGGIFNDSVTTNFLLIPTVKKWKSVNTGWSYWHMTLCHFGVHPVHCGSRRWWGAGDIDSVMTYCTRTSLGIGLSLEQGIIGTHISCKAAKEHGEHGSAAYIG